MREEERLPWEGGRRSSPQAASKERSGVQDLPGKLSARKFETSHVGGATGRTPPIPRSVENHLCSHAISASQPLDKHLSEA